MCWYSCKVPAFFSEVIQTELSRQIFEIQSDLMKILPILAELLHADGRTDGHDEANNSKVYRYSSPMLFKLELSRKIFEIQSDLMKILPLLAELFHTDGRTDGRK